MVIWTQAVQKALTEYICSTAFSAGWNRAIFDQRDWSWDIAQHLKTVCGVLIVLPREMVITSYIIPGKIGTGITLNFSIRDEEQMDLINKVFGGTQWSVICEDT